MKVFLSLLTVAGLWTCPLLAQDAEPLLSQTIEHLIQYVEKSGLTYIRNGTEYDSVSAAAHLREKYNYFRSSILTPEDFIQKAASKSIMTGQPYFVKLSDGTKKQLDEWLLSELKSYRKAVEKES